MMARSKKKRPAFLLPLGVLAVVILVGFFLLNRSPEGPHLTLYFYEGGTLKAAKRPIETDPEPSQAIRALLAGPTLQEMEEGVTTEIPEGVKLLSMEIQNGVAATNLSAGLASYGGGAAKVQGMLAQIVYTATEFPEIQKVRLLVNGSGDVVLGGEGLVIDRPLGRMDVRF